MSPYNILNLSTIRCVFSMSLYIYTTGMVNPTIPGKCDLFCVKVNIHKVLISFWLQLTVRMRLQRSSSKSRA